MSQVAAWRSDRVTRAQPGEFIQRAIDLIRHQPGIRTPAIATVLNLTEKQVDAMLAHACEDGLLITCDVAIADGVHVVEYRCSTAGAVKNPFRVWHPPRALSPEEPMEKKKPLKERIADALRKHGRLTLAQIAEHAGTTTATLSSMMSGLPGVRRVSHGVYALEGNGEAAAADMLERGARPAADELDSALRALLAKRLELQASLEKVERAIAAIEALA